jgi:RNA polymerase sigma-70 factor (ECF subfamily)
VTNYAENYVDLIAIARSSELPLERRHAAFGRLVEQHQNAAFQWAFTTLEDRHLAQDVTQEAFLVAYQHLPKLRDPQAFPAWLHQIVLSQCCRVMRQRQPPTIPLEMADELPLNDLDLEQVVVECDLKESVLAALDRLPLHEQTVTRLFYLRGYSLKEIARLLQVPVTTVKKRLQYARQHLRQGALSAYDGISQFRLLEWMRAIEPALRQLLLIHQPALIPCYVELPASPRRRHLSDRHIHGNWTMLRNGGWE